MRFRFVTEADGESEAAKVGVRGSSHQDEIRESPYADQAAGLSFRHNLVFGGHPASQLSKEVQ